MKNMRRVCLLPGLTYLIQVAPAGTTGAADGVCNEQVPNNSVYARFLWVVRFLTHNNFYVVIDNHLANDNTAATNPAQWAALWAQVPAPHPHSAVFSGFLWTIKPETLKLCCSCLRPGHPCKCQIAHKLCVSPLRTSETKLRNCFALSKLIPGETSTHPWVDMGLCSS